MKSKEYLKELAKKEIKELNSELQKERSKLQELRSNLALGKLKNYREINEAKKHIAQISTIVNDRAMQMIAKDNGDSKEKSNA